MLSLKVSKIVHILVLLGELADINGLPVEKVVLWRDNETEHPEK